MLAPQLLPPFSPHIPPHHIPTHFPTTYLCSVLKVELATLGSVMKTLPYLVMFAMSNVGGWAGDWLILRRKYTVAQVRSRSFVWVWVCCQRLPPPPWWGPAWWGVPVQLCAP